MLKKIALINGRVHTPSGLREALLIEGGRIMEAGTASDIARHQNAELIDLKGRSVLPGFGDSHMHLLKWLESRETLDLNACDSIEGLRASLRSYMETHPASGGWYHGRGWNHTRMAEGRMPHRRDIDDLSPGQPVILTRTCGHVALLNTVALERLGITPDTHIDGGIIELDDEGPTGILCEDAITYISPQIPRLQEKDMLELLEKYGPEIAGFGLTQLHTDDLSMFGRDYRRAIGFYTDAGREGKLPFRVRQQFLIPERDALLEFLSDGWRTGDGTPMYQIGPLKLLCDGSLGGRTAFLSRGYADAPDERGVALFEQENLNRLVALAHTSGIQVVVHAIGDGALEMCLDAFEAAQSEGSGFPRHAIVHAQIAGDRQLDRMKRLRLCAAIQPSFAPSDRNMAAERLGKEWAERSYRWKTMLRRGIPLAGGSDSPVESLRPLDGIHAAVTRHEKGAPAEGQASGDWTFEERLSVAEAVSLYTWGVAWIGGNERRRGEISEGKEADLVVLDEDPFLVSPSDLWKIGVAMTLCGGRVTHRSAAFGGF